MKTLQNTKSLFKHHSGMMRTAQLLVSKIYYKDIQKLVAGGFIEKVRYGYYQWIDSENGSEVPTLIHLYPDGIFCMETALFYHGYSDRTPSAWHIAVSKHSTKSRFKLDFPFVKPYYLEPTLLELGLMSGEMDSFSVRVYDKERCICDCLRYVKKMDKEIFNKAIQAYVNDAQKNITSLLTYAKKLRCEKKVKDLIGVWL